MCHHGNEKKLEGTGGNKRRHSKKRCKDGKDRSRGMEGKSMRKEMRQKRRIKRRGCGGQEEKVAMTTGGGGMLQEGQARR